MFVYTCGLWNPESGSLTRQTQLKTLDRSTYVAKGKQFKDKDINKALVSILYHYFLQINKKRK